jgi:hypothetical protein
MQQGLGLDEDDAGEEETDQAHKVTEADAGLDGRTSVVTRGGCG